MWRLFWNSLNRTCSPFNMSTWVKPLSDTQPWQWKKELGPAETNTSLSLKLMQTCQQTIVYILSLASSDICIHLDSCFCHLPNKSLAFTLFALFLCVFVCVWDICATDQHLNAVEVVACIPYWSLLSYWVKCHLRHWFRLIWWSF